mmetsp:Transcript_4259/g.11035  ORF Transcript_4259/g.11035 Transcript_4259/m.11035 type:complete len:350 (+) Transcript_4259:110-1159(+)|eukprot:CAMPEP_0197191676 /NCGR_PEP_ID=MMETSP1423-20130617/23782_1 /TAXON_ID=476441 /ORGANISM="Pseudo-nitzschia heimii, Strain UNC1101" /LENGTH=349 /DNA_ID=CAMNT_0042644375 /DNA_START=97 /DNA_END=1146 /DNA_ORIENTATION=+
MSSAKSKDGSSDAKPPATPASSSSSSSCWWFLAVIPFAVVAVVGGLGLAASPGPDAVPGLDYGTGNMFDKIATRYDLINRVLAMNMDIGWRRAMTHRIRDKLLARDAETGGEERWKILDMATGTADVALQLVGDLSGSHPTTVLGLDPSENMLSVGRSKIATQRLSQAIVLETADARDLSGYYDRTAEISERFDAATMAFGIRNVVPDRSKALCEIHKLLKPDGILAILEFSDPSYETGGYLGVAAGVFIRHVVPFVGGILSGARQEYLHLQNSIREFPGPEVFRSILQTLDCQLRADDADVHFYTGHYEMEDVVYMNFGSVQLYLGRAAVRQKRGIGDTKLPSIGTVG